MNVYLDHAATTPLHPKVLEKMIPFLKEEFGNASSIHSYGRKARVAVEEAREAIAGFINADAGEIYFTSGGTEANNFVLSGIARSDFKETGRNEIISGSSEHASVYESIKELANNEFTLKLLNTSVNGSVDISELGSLLTGQVSLLSLIHTNNETGAMNNIQAVSKIIKDKNIYFHTDAVQSFGKIKINVKELNINSLTASAHKIRGPKGIGFAYVKSGTPLLPLIYGGSQERNRRGGTENVAGIIGFAEAVKIAHENMNDSLAIVSNLKSLMIKGIKSIDSAGLTINSAGNSSPYILSITFDSCYYNNDAEAMLIFLDINGIAASNGAACSSGTLKPSRVVLSMGKSEADANGTIRFSFGPDNTEEEINYTLDVLKKMADKFKL